ncbi:hypothetical protein [Thiomicrorhabdus sediminis]|nr:hypothetical protein [Thiomicrorhabdus sediminis]
MHGHKLNLLWKKITPQLQEIIIGMHNNNTGIPLTNALTKRRKVFESELNELALSGKSGHAQPFNDWRYPYELKDMKLMSLETVFNLMETFGQAAQYVKTHEEMASEEN